MVEDIGDMLGYVGAHVAELRRLASGCFQLDEHLTLESLQQIADEQGLQD